MAATRSFKRCVADLVISCHRVAWDLGPGRLCRLPSLAAICGAGEFLFPLDPEVERAECSR